jgi:hypothetical protein
MTAAAKKRGGRPRIFKNPNKLHGLYLDVKTVERARAIGKGNISAGVREAVKIAHAAMKELGEL